MNKVYVILHGHEEPDSSLTFQYIDTIWPTKESAEGHLRIIMLLKSESARKAYVQDHTRPYCLKDNSGHYFEIQEHSLRVPGFMHEHLEKETSNG